MGLDGIRQQGIHRAAGLGDGQTFLIDKTGGQGNQLRPRQRQPHQLANGLRARRLPAPAKSPRQNHCQAPVSGKEIDGHDI